MAGLVGGPFSYMAPGVSVEGFLLAMLVAWLCGQAIGWMYSWSSGVLSYSQTFVQSLVLLTMIVALISGVIGDSLAKAFGLAGAMAVVRFRTPVKDARDAVYLFFAVAVGMAIGTGNPLLGVLATLIIGLAGVTLDWSSYGSRSSADGMLRFRFQGDPAKREEVSEILRRHCRAFTLSAARVAAPGGPEELVYDVNLRSAKTAPDLVKDLTATGSVTSVSLLPLARAGES